jgi:hypothetical protein
MNGTQLFGQKRITVEIQKSRGRGGSGSCYKCGSKEHIAADCDRSDDRGRRGGAPYGSSKCYNCGKVGINLF